MTTATEAPAHPTEEWTYQGIRLSNGKRYHAWLTPEGKTWYYGKVAASVIGGTYAVQVERTSDNGATVYGHPRYQDGPDNYDEAAMTQAAKWEATDAVAKAELSAKARERSKGKQTALDQALAPLEDIARTLRTSADRDAFAAYVLRRMQTAWARG